MLLEWNGERVFLGKGGRGAHLSKPISRSAIRDEFGVVRGPELVCANPGIAGDAADGCAKTGGRR
jgi:hypothetical protein